MANLKDLRARKKSVQATRKITAAMKMIAAAKLQKAQKRAEDARPYAQLMTQIMEDLLESRTRQVQGPALLVGTGEKKVHLFVVATSNRGLCGGFNSQVVKLARLKIEKTLTEGGHVKIICIGRKARDQLKRDYAPHILETVPTFENPAFSNATTLSQKVIALFEAKEFDVCTLLYNKFISVLTNKPVAQQLIPFSPTSHDFKDSFKGQQRDTKEPDSNPPQSLSSLYEYEPNKEAVLQELLPRNLSVQFYRALLESTASEHAARMTAMDGATRNAGDMIHNLDLILNRTRQAQITMELTEIISGAEAL